MIGSRRRKARLRDSANAVCGRYKINDFEMRQLLTE